MLKREETWISVFKKTLNYFVFFLHCMKRKQNLDGPVEKSARKCLRKQVIFLHFKMHILTKVPGNTINAWKDCYYHRYDHDDVLKTSPIKSPATRDRNCGWLNVKIPKMKTPFLYICIGILSRTSKHVPIQSDLPTYPVCLAAAEGCWKGEQ